jgi:tetratricopeptide (TPR) repeat protein
MFVCSPHCRVFVLRWLAFLLLLVCLGSSPKLPEKVAASQAASSEPAVAHALDLIYRQKYNDAITQLEQVLESNPRSGEALTYLATANLYHDLDFSKARTEFEAAFKAGGGATFFVTHSHEKLNTGDAVDYCRGWLHLRSTGVEFISLEGGHSFKWSYDEIEEFKTNRLSKTVFHIKTAGKSQNFHGRSNHELEPLLIIALYKSFTRH